MNNRDWVKALAFISQIGVTVAACIIIGVFGGMFLDNLFGTSPWILIAGSILGVLAALKSILDLVPKG